jgi:hypothetical protein
MRGGEVIGAVTAFAGIWLAASSPAVQDQEPDVYPGRRTLGVVPEEVNSRQSLRDIVVAHLKGA